MVLNKSLDALNEFDLQSLVDNGVSEGKTIEYKQNLPNNTREDKKEFLADISSLANASGGYIIYGMREDAGVAVELCGLQSIDPDAEILRLDNIIRDSISPRIPGVSMRAIPLHTSNIAIIIHVPHSWAQPHVVDFQGHWRFYSRSSVGKYPLDVSELRSAFTLSDAITDRIRTFRVERLGKIVAGEIPVALEQSAKVVLHIVPIGAFDPSSRYDVAPLANHTGRLAPIYHNGWNNRHNFDGFLTYTPASKPSIARTYLQIFRNGSIEAVETYLLRRKQDETGSIPSIFEKALIQALERFLSIQKDLGVTLPLFIMLSLMGVQGYIMDVSPSRTFGHDAYPIDRNDLILPEIIVDNFDRDPSEVLRPAFDAIWSATGWPQSINYNGEGRWIG